MGLEEQRAIGNRLRQVNEEVWKYYNKIYSDDSNDIFDAEHDSLYYHIQGFNYTLEEWEEDVHSAPNNRLGDKELESWSKATGEEEKFVEELKAYYNAVVKATPPNYIYA